MTGLCPRGSFLLGGRQRSCMPQEMQKRFVRADHDVEDSFIPEDPVRAPTSATSASGHASASPPRRRLVGLDMLRGLTMFVMLLVDYTGGCYPGLDHAPWDGLHL